MAKVTYASLKLKTNTSINTFDFQGQTIEVLKYLPVEQKDDLVIIASQNAEENGIYNPIKLDMYFHLYLVYMYTNLTFTDKQKENEAKLYDTLKSNGFIEALLQNIDEEEYEELYEYILTYQEDMLKYKNTAGGVLQSLIQDLPRNAQMAAEIVDNFDKNKFQAVVDFATAANGGRKIELFNQGKND